MPQQINLYLPLLRKRKESFTAQTLVQALVIVLLGGAVVTAAWVWNLQRAADSLRQTLQAQDKELGTLRDALASAQSSAGPDRVALLREQELRQTELQRRQQVLAAITQGIHEPGRGHAARLLLVAQTIPGTAWVRTIQTDETRLDVVGYTLVPEALNDWVGKLAASDLLRGQTLDAIKVERLPAPAASAAGAPAQWSFHLVSRAALVAPALAASQAAQAVQAVQAVQAAVGGKP